MFCIFDDSLLEFNKYRLKFSGLALTPVQSSIRDGVVQDFARVVEIRCTLHRNIAIATPHRLGPRHLNPIDHLLSGRRPDTAEYLKYGSCTQIAFIVDFAFPLS